MANQHTMPDHQYVLRFETRMPATIHLPDPEQSPPASTLRLGRLSGKANEPEVCAPDAAVTPSDLPVPRNRVLQPSVPSRVITPFATDTADNVQRPVHHPEMNTGEVFADYAKSEKLCAGKDGNQGGDKRKPRDTPLKKIATNDINQNAHAKQCAGKTNHARKLQRERAKAGHHVKRVADQLPKRVIGWAS